MLLHAVPFGMVFLGNLGICALNYLYYGIFAISDRSQTAFRTVCEDFLNTSCEGNEDPENVWVSRNQYEKAIDASPTLTEIKDELMTWYDNWSTSHLDDGQCDGDFYVWALRNGASSAGYYRDAVTTAEFWEKAADELDQAFKDGRLEKSDGLLLSFSSRKLKGEDIGTLLTDTFKNFYINVSSAGSEAELSAVTDAVQRTQIRRFEAMLHDFMVYDDAFMGGGEDAVSNAASYIVRAANIVIGIYEIMTVPMLMLIPVSLAGCIVLLIIKKEKAIRRMLTDTVIIAVGMLLSAFLMQAMVTWFISFIHGMSMDYLLTFYASPVQPLTLLSALLPAFVCGQVFIDRRKHGSDVKESDL